METVHYTHNVKGGDYIITDENAFIKLKGEWVPAVVYKSTDTSVKKTFVRTREEFHLKLTKIKSYRNCPNCGHANTVEESCNLYTCKYCDGEEDSEF